MAEVETQQVEPENMASEEASIPTEPDTKSKTYNNVKIEELLARTGYPLEITATCRAYGGPPPDFTGDEPTCTSQVS